MAKWFNSLSDCRKKKKQDKTNKQAKNLWSELLPQTQGKAKQECLGVKLEAN